MEEQGAGKAFRASAPTPTGSKRRADPGPGSPHTHGGTQGTCLWPRAFSGTRGPSYWERAPPQWGRRREEPILETGISGNNSRVLALCLRFLSNPAGIAIAPPPKDQTRIADDRSPPQVPKELGPAPRGRGLAWQPFRAFQRFLPALSSGGTSLTGDLMLR